MIARDKMVFLSVFGISIDLTSDENIQPISQCFCMRTVNICANVSNAVLRRLLS